MGRRCSPAWLHQASRSTQPAITTEITKHELTCMPLTPGESACQGAIRRSSAARSLDLLKAGRTVAQVAHDLQISDQTIYNWRQQELIDTGQMPGLSSSDDVSALP